MAGEAKCPFPLLVEGDWGGSGLPKNLKKKLLCYFQSGKKSGGGECEIQERPGQVLVCFAQEEVRQRVLDKKIHELDWAAKGKLKLVVMQPETTGATKKDVSGEVPGPKEESETPSKPQEPVCSDDGNSVSVEQEKRTDFSSVISSSGNLGKETTSSEQSTVVIITAPGEEIDDDLVSMYFENKMRSGGGPIKSCVRNNQQIIITFENAEDAQEVLKKKDHVVKKIALHVKPWQVENIQELPQMTSSLVVLENIQETTKQCMLTMLVENISGLSEDDNDFNMEMIPEVNAAVVTFIKDIDIRKFVEKFNQNHRAKQQNITARHLEVTKSIKAEHVPPNVSNDYITVYFESKRNGSAQVSDVEQLPEENAAIITFHDQKDVNTVLAKQHSLDKVPIYVYPYYSSLGTALYGKKRPQIKLPEPITMSLDPYILQFLQTDNRLIQEINHEMADCKCELMWPQSNCANPEITLCPSNALSKQRSMIRLIKTWNEDVSKKFSCSMSKYKAIKCEVNSVVWEAIRNCLVKDGVLIIPDIPKNMVVLVGNTEIMKGAEQELKELIENARKKIEREKQSIEQTMLVDPGKYAILHLAGLEENVYKEYPSLKIHYDASSKSISLYGVAAEVFKVKSEILEKVHSMAQKSINVHPYIFQFLQHVDNETLSQHLFMSNQINAFYELGTDNIMLIAGSPGVLLEAEEEMKKVLTYKCIDLEDNSVLKKREWRELVNHLYKAHNCSKETIIIVELEDQIVIAGYFRAVAEAYQQLSDFVDKHTLVQKVVIAKCVAVVMFVEKEKSNIWLELKKKGVKIEFGTQNKRKGISLSGPRAEVLQAVTKIEQILSSLHSENVVIDKPGAKVFFKEQEHLYVTGVKQQFNCLIRLQEGEEQREDGEVSNVYKKQGQPACEKILQDGVVVAVYKGDLCSHPADVVVNASNEDLKHIGGLAEALLKAAGPELQTECDRIVQKRGPLQPGRAVITDAGNLRCKQVIHAVGPRWNDREPEKCVRLLKRAVKESLRLAETYNHHSIAIPAISSGIFGFPLKLCAQSIAKSIKETLEDSPGESCLKEIYFVDSSEKTVQAFTDAFKDVFRDKSPRHNSSPPSDAAFKPRKSRNAQSRKGLQTVTTDEGLSIILEKGGIEDATTDVIVNSVSRDLQLDKGPLSKALLSKAGPMLQAQLSEEGLEKVASEGSVFKTDGCNLGCRFVLHAIVPGWKNGEESVQKLLRDIITECLQTAEQLSLKSITFPAIGTGNLGFPKPVVAKLMFDQVFKFSRKKKIQSLEEVHFLLHPNDTHNIQAFSDELQNRASGNITNVKMHKTVPENAQQGQAFFGPISTPKQGVHEMQIGSITFQIASGDITTKKTDVIVNISNQTFNLKTGVSKAILEGAGPQVEAECAQLASQPHDDLITTQAGNLMCKKIIHLVAQNDTKSLVSKVLQECELKKYTSVAFPAIGTGQAGLDPAVVANNMMDAVVDFASDKSVQIVKNIKIIIFQPQLLSVFHACMQKREGTANVPDTPASESFLSKCASFFGFGKQKHHSSATEKKPAMVLEKKIERTVFQICGESQKNVEDTVSWIKNLILKEQHESTISDEWISSFDDQEYKELTDLQKKLYIIIQLECKDPVPFIRVSGVTKDVLRACLEIQCMIKRVRAVQEEQSKAELLSNLVEWQYLENNRYLPFDRLTNLRLEDAAALNQKEINITIWNKNYKVDLEAKRAIDDTGKIMAILRVSKDEGKQLVTLPEEWCDMKQERVKVVELHQEMKEYQDVQMKFQETCSSFKIEKIERIQNPFYWQTYQIKKQEMDSKNGNTNNERRLFHGTTSGSLTIINNKGFNRSYAGMNVRQRVLDKKTHELDLPEKGGLKLVVTWPETTGATEEAVFQEELDPEQALKTAGKAQEQDVQEVLRRKEHSVQNSARHVENIQEHPQTTSSLLVLENIEESVTECMLIMLLETISGLSGDKDFSMEMIPEINAAVVTFIKRIDTVEFLDICAQNNRMKHFKITARLLELTQSIKAENIPSNVPKDYITIYFESPKNGGGPVLDVKHFREEKSAIITFCDHKDLNTVLGKQHSLDQTSISVYPYYSSLGTALYGEKRPLIKMPEPIRIPVDPYILQFLQSHDRLIQEINQEMENCHCELKWPQAKCTYPEITLCPSATLSKQRRSMIKLIGTWKEDVSTEFSCVMSKYKTSKCKVNAVVWEAIKNRLATDHVLTIPDISKEMVIIAGDMLAVEDVEKELNEHMENAVRETKREKQKIEITMSVPPGKYAILHNAGLEKNIYKEYPCLKISYDAAKKTISLCGVPAEVYKVKSDILEKVQNMAQKSITIHPQIFQFLQHIDNETLSQSLFVTNQVNAFYQLENDTVLLVGDCPEVLLEAEERMKTELDYKCIPLEDREVIKKREWRELTSILYKTYNASQETLIMDDLLPLEGDQKVVIAGYSKAVAEAYRKLSEFVDRNTQVQKLIPVQSVAVVQFIEKEKSHVCHELRKKDVTINFGTQTSRKSISLSGPKVEVLKGIHLIEQILSSLYSTNVLIDKPGAKAFFRDKERLYVSEVKHQFNCLIRLQEDGEEQREDGETGNDTTKQLRCKMILQDGIVVAVYKGDLCSHPADVVVNASNEDLKHIGGLAEALLKAAGPELQTECDHIVRKRGPLQPGRAVITDAGNLPCKQVIHAVGPRWRDHEPEKCVRLLKRAIKESLQLAETYNHHSIAIPAISSGIFGFPLKLCAQSIAKSIKETLEDSPGESCLREIHLVDFTEKTVQVLTDALKDVFTEKSPQLSLLPQSKTGHQPRESRGAQNRKGLQMVTTDEGLSVILEKRDIQDATTDVIVSSVGQDLRLGVGPLSQSLLQKAGPTLQLEFNEESQRQVPTQGSVFHTSGCNLACSFLFHAVVPVWDQGRGGAMTNLEDIVKECLKKTEELSLRSITFPAIGTGGFGFPKPIVAKLMFDEVFKFSSNHNLKSLQEVHFLLHPRDTDNIQAFTDELESRTNGNLQAASSSPISFGHVSTPVLGVHEMQFGSITLQVATGDITKENTDVIVNISNSSFNAKSGVFKAVMEAAGPQVKLECNMLALQPHSGFITTQGGKLMCNKIIHLIHQKDVKAQVSKVLQECELRKYTSVAFPAIGTGQAGQNPAKVAEDMMDAIVEFASTKAVQHVKKIKIVIFQPEMQNVFYASMQKREGDTISPTSESWFSKLTSLIMGKKRPAGKKRGFVLEKKIELATFQICGESQKNVEATESWIKNLILKEQYDNVIPDELIGSFDETEAKKLSELQKSLHITIHVETKETPPFVRVSGITRDVYEASMKIQNMIKSIKDNQEEQSKAKLVSNLVQWKYSINNMPFIDFDPLTNMHLEDAKVAKKTYINIKLLRKDYKVDMKNLRATDEQGTVVTIQREPKDEGKQLVAFPKEWCDMKQERVKVVMINTTQQEYQDVQKKFLKTCSTFKIEKIERVQNPYLWQTYQIKKQSLDKKNGNTINETLLFHGTPSSSLSTINYNGFNRGFVGINGAAIGNGTYFAVDASYSAQDTYSRPDGNGRKYMYLARVLTGIYCTGKGGLITPPAKNIADPTDLYDSVTDNMGRPSMFVIFNDIQAYPEYLITFRR
nr:protein mono-ADP-ribosyltransferase PARP14 isoform X1 [Chrysemys picta bellii]XP_042699054.1 protein mono-ADP-ribosyltransferase PARP14 isoform X2 [Chrysemys picta bellii]